MKLVTKNLPAGDRWCFYYLDPNGRLVFKSKDYDRNFLDEAVHVIAYWILDLNDRAAAYRMLLQALTLGADKEEIYEHAAEFNMNNQDVERYLVRYKMMSERAGNVWQVKMIDQLHPIGTGNTKFQALADWCLKKSAQKSAL